MISPWVAYIGLSLHEAFLSSEVSTLLEELVFETSSPRIAQLVRGF